MTAETTPTRWHVGLLGCGPISEFHARAISRVPGARLAGVADLDTARAEALAARFGNASVCRGLDDLIAAGVNVVHVLTPPHTHAALAIAAMEKGCHVYVEKPLATKVEDCERIAAAAAATGRTVGIGHSLLRDPAVCRAFAAIAAGAVGEVISVDYLRSQPAPPVPATGSARDFRAGGFPFRDSGIHAVYLTEALLGPMQDAHVKTAANCRDPLIHCDEWQVLAACERGMAHLHISWAVKPWQSVLTVTGTKGVLRADLFAQTVTVRAALPLPGPAVRLVNTWSESLRAMGQSAAAVGKVALKKQRQYHGLQDLITEFYGDLTAGKAPAVSAEAARSAVQWTEAIAAHGDAQRTAFEARFHQAPTAPILVTGAGGFIGRRLVDKLVAEGQRVRALVRREPPKGWLQNPQIEVLLADLGDDEAMSRAIAGTEKVFHLGAAMRGSVTEFDRATIEGTRILVEQCLAHGVKGLIYVSSLGVLHFAVAKVGEVMGEDWPTEPRSSERGHYTRAKVAAEKLVLDAVRERGLHAIVLRPGEVVGAGAPWPSPSVAQRAGSAFVLLGDGNLQPPLVAVEDVVDALCAAAQNGPFDGTVLHLVDAEPVSRNMLLARYQQAQARPGAVIRVPHPVVWVLALGVEKLCARLGRAAPLSRYRVVSALGPRAFSGARAKQVLGWEPRFGVLASLDAPAPGSKE